LATGDERQGGFVGEDPVTHAESLIAYAHVEPGGWVVLAMDRASDVYAPSWTLTATIATCAVVCAALAAAAGISALRSVRRHHVALAGLDESRQLLAGMIIHDLRNPLTATQGWIELARVQTRPDSAVADCLGSAASAARGIQNLADTLVDVMRLEDGHMPFTPVASRTSSNSHASASRSSMRPRRSVPSNSWRRSPRTRSTRTSTPTLVRRVSRIS